MVEGVTKQIAAISGGLGDIGRACAIKLATQGMDIAAGDVDVDDRVRELQQQVEGLHRRFHFAQVDVANEASVNHWFDGIENKLGVANVESSMQQSSSFAISTT